MTREQEPGPKTSHEVQQRERTITRLKNENTSLKQEVERVRTDYAALVAERRCEVIDGLDDCLAAGLQRPERFRESDAQFIREREAQRARQTEEEQKRKAAASVDSSNLKSPQKSTTQKLLDLLHGIPGVKAE